MDNITNIVTGIYNSYIEYDGTQLLSTQNIQYELYKNIYSFFNSTIDINVINAYPKTELTDLDIYYWEPFILKDLVSTFTWTPLVNMENAYVSTNFDFFNNFNISATIKEYMKYNDEILTLSAYYIDVHHYLYLNKSSNINLHIHLPKVDYISTAIYYPYRLDELQLKQYLQFEENQKFQNYLKNTGIKINKIVGKFYKDISIDSQPNNNSKFIFNKSYKYNHNYIYVYCTAYVNTKQAGIECLLQLAPVYVALANNKYFFVRDNSFATFMSLLQDNLQYYNCRDLNTTLTINKNNLYNIDHNGNKRQANTLLSANNYGIQYSAYYNDSYTKLSTSNFITSGILNCIYIAPYDVDLNKTFYIPCNLSGQTECYINLSTQLINSQGINNELLTFNFNYNDRIIKFNKRNYGAAFHTDAQLIISTYIKKQQLVDQTAGTLTFIPCYWTTTNEKEVSIYNNNTYNLFDLLSTSNNKLTNDTITYISAISQYSNYINILSCINDNLSSKSYELIYYPSISSCYRNIQFNDNKNKCNITINEYGKYFNRLINNKYYIYLSGNQSQYLFTDEIFNYKEQNLPVSCIVITSFFENNLSDQTKIKLLQSQILSSYISDNTFNIFNYTALNYIFNNCVQTNLVYYNLIDNVYLKVPQIFIGSLNTNYNIRYNDNNISGIFNKQTEKFEFNLFNIPTSTNLFLTINDSLDYNILQFNILEFNKNQYILIQDSVQTIRYYSDGTSSINQIHQNIIDRTDNQDNYEIKTNNFTTNIISEENTLSSYGGYIEYDNEIIKNKYNYIELNETNLSTIYYAYLPNISTEIINGSDIQTGSTTKYYYPVIIDDYYRSTIQSPYNVTTFTQPISTLFKYKTSALANSVNDLIINNTTTLLSTTYYTCQIKDQNFIFTFTRTKYDKYINENNNAINNINVYCKFSSKKKFGVFSFFIDQQK